MNIKTKLQLGFGFLFMLAVLTSGASIFYLNRMADVSKAVLKDNYATVDYAKSMLQDLNSMNGDRPQAPISDFDMNLKKQEANITEPGEAEFTARLRLNFEKTRHDKKMDQLLSNQMQSDLFALMHINMLAIVRKNTISENTSKDAIIIVSLISSICFLIAFTFILNFPGYIANPIKELTFGITEIAKRNYSQRLNYSKSDEFRALADSFNTMAEKLNEFENSNLAKIAFQKRRIETIINNMSDLIIGFDEHNLILFANQMACNLLGLKEVDMIGVYAPDLALKNDLFRTLIRKSTEKELKIYADNKESYFNKESYDVKIQDQILGKVIILKNITQFQELDRAKTNFIATISHELKTPISAIKMSLKLLSDERVGKLNHEQEQMITNIGEDTQRLLNITGELLDLAQVETGNITLNVQETEPLTIVDYALNAIKIPAKQKSIEIVLQEPGRTGRVIADQEKTAWVLVNFLSNAVRYSPEKGKIILNIKQEKTQVEFSVQDFGKGIEEKYRRRIFDRFFKVPSESGFGDGGSGLGLSISKDFIESQGGKIWVESEVDEGSRFYFTLNRV